MCVTIFAAGLLISRNWRTNIREIGIRSSPPITGDRAISTKRLRSTAQTGALHCLRERELSTADEQADTPNHLKHFSAACIASLFQQRRPTRQSQPHSH